jgi:hypothetical protein
LFILLGQNVVDNHSNYFPFFHTELYIKRTINVDRIIKNKLTYIPNKVEIGFHIVTLEEPGLTLNETDSKRITLHYDAFV